MGILLRTTTISMPDLVVAWLCDASILSSFPCFKHVMRIFSSESREHLESLVSSQKFSSTSCPPVSPESGGFIHPWETEDIVKKGSTRLLKSFCFWLFSSKEFFWKEWFSPCVQIWLEISLDIKVLSQAWKIVGYNWCQELPFAVGTQHVKHGANKKVFFSESLYFQRSIVRSWWGNIHLMGIIYPPWPLQICNSAKMDIWLRLLPYLPFNIIQLINSGKANFPKVWDIFFDFFNGETPWGMAWQNLAT